MLGDKGAAALAKSKSLKQVNLASNEVGFEGAHALSFNTMITHLDLSSNKLGDAGAIVLARNDTLVDLALNYNYIYDSGAVILAESKFLKRLSLNCNFIQEQGKKALAENKSIDSSIVSIEQLSNFPAYEYESMFLLSESYLYITDLDGIIRLFNPAIAKTLGYTDDELFGKIFFDLLHPDDRKP